VLAGCRTAADVPHSVLAEAVNWPVNVSQLLVSCQALCAALAVSCWSELQCSGFAGLLGCSCGRSKASYFAECSMFDMQVVLLDGTYACAVLVALCSRHALHAAAESWSQVAATCMAAAYGSLCSMRPAALMLFHLHQAFVTTLDCFTQPGSAVLGIVWLCAATLIGI
jgi:hypothetical protein